MHRFLRWRLAAAALAVGCAAVVGCAGPGNLAGVEASPDTAPQDSSPATVTPVAEGPVLVAQGMAFDPVSHDVEPDEDCEGIAGRETLETFDRAAWPELDVPAGEAIMTCGNAQGAGWRHIADGHTGDFTELAQPIGSDWEDVAWFAIDRALEQPTRVEEYRDDIVNYDVLVELLEDGEVTRSWIVTVGVGLRTTQVITAFPDEQQ